MSNTIVDMPKVTQMLDAGWRVILFKNPLTSYSAQATHPEQAFMAQSRARLIEYARGHGRYKDVERHVDSFHFDGEYVCTDDFTPEQALTRLAYKAIGGEII